MNLDWLGLAWETRAVLMGWWVAVALEEAEITHFVLATWCFLSAFGTRPQLVAGRFFFFFFFFDIPWLASWEATHVNIYKSML